ncbi:11197_t:CDS:2 [Ambispora gerdemannii]|uniref:11197_t:CDS:1 n=1 Tax=Ambispora gerdemannii TaxID=144530 RepID=A0A9N8Z2R0_9GLOM|nr:11197_t:CDS:2 [Ambispora gerdemannii]
MKKNKDFKNLTEAEIIARLDSDNYEGGNIGLLENPTLEERTKYKLCKSILTYQLKNKLPLEQVAEKLAISEEELYDICRGKINDFSIARLIFYLEKLTPNYDLLHGRALTGAERVRVMRAKTILATAPITSIKYKKALDQLKELYSEGVNPNKTKTELKDRYGQRSMNYPLQSQLKIFEKTLLAKQKVANQAYFQQLIKTELSKLLKTLPKGVDKEEVLKYVQDITSSSNFQKEVKEVAIETVYEFFGKTNFKNDNQNLKQSLTDGEAKTITSQLVEEKLGGKEKFQEGVYRAKSQIVQAVVKELKAKGVILKELRNIIGQEKFYSDEPADSIPKGREGYYKKDKEIALLQAEANAKIKAIESDVKTAEGVYKDALLKGEEIVGGDFTKLEENQINKAPTPEKIQAVLKDIPITIDVKALYQLNPNGLINNDKVIENYTTKVLVMGKEYQQTTTHLETLKHSAEEVDKVHEFIVKRIETETNLNKFPADSETQTTYQEKKVPDTRSWEEVGKIRDNKIKTAPTGLPNTGQDQRKAFDNGITNIEVLKVNKQDIDQEIAKVDNLVKQINSYQYLRDLDANQATIVQQFQALKTNLLPPTKPQEITTALTKQRENL